jgi:hypothetical protein
MATGTTSPSGLTAEQLAACLAANASWPFAAHEDGWVKAHDALRLDMADFDAALAVLAAQEAAGQQLTAWQVRGLRRSAAARHREPAVAH